MEDLDKNSNFSINDEKTDKINKDINLSPENSIPRQVRNHITYPEQGSENNNRNNVPNRNRRLKKRILIIFLIIILITACTLILMFFLIGNNSNSTYYKNKFSIIQRNFDVLDSEIIKNNFRICIDSNFNDKKNEEVCSEVRSKTEFIVLNSSYVPIIPKEINFKETKYQILKDIKNKMYNNLYNDNNLEENQFNLVIDEHNLFISNDYKTFNSEDIKKSEHTSNKDKPTFYTFALVLNEFIQEVDDKIKLSYKFEDGFKDDINKDISESKPIIYFILREDGTLISVYKPIGLSDVFYKHLIDVLKQYTPFTNINFYINNACKNTEINGDYLSNSNYYFYKYNGDDQYYKDYTNIKKVVNNQSFIDNIPDGFKLNSEIIFEFDKLGNLVGSNEKSVTNYVDNVQTDNKNTNEREDIFEDYIIPSDVITEINAKSNFKSYTKEKNVENTQLKELVKKNSSNSIYEEDFELTKLVKDLERIKDIQYINRINQIEDYLNKTYNKKNNKNHVLSIQEIKKNISVNSHINKFIKERILEETSSIEELENIIFTIYIPLIKINKSGIEIELGVSASIDAMNDVLVLDLLINTPKTGIKNLTKNQFSIKIKKSIIDVFNYIKKGAVTIITITDIVDKILNTELLESIKNTYNDIISKISTKSDLPKPDNLFDTALKIGYDKIQIECEKIVAKITAYISDNLHKIKDPLLLSIEEFKNEIKNVLKKYKEKLEAIFSDINNSINSKFAQLINNINNEEAAIFLPDIEDYLNSFKLKLKAKIDEINYPITVRLDFIKKGKLAVLNITNSAKNIIFEIKTKINDSITSLPFDHLKDLFENLVNQTNKAVDNIDNNIDEFNDVVENTITIEEFNPLKLLVNKCYEIFDNESNKVISILKEKTKKIKNYEFLKNLFEEIKEIPRIFKLFLIDNYHDNIQHLPFDKLFGNILFKDIDSGLFDNYDKITESLSDIILEIVNKDYLELNKLYIDLDYFISYSYKLLTDMYNKSEVSLLFNKGDIFSNYIINFIESSNLISILKSFDSIHNNNNNNENKLLICEENLAIILKYYEYIDSLDSNIDRIILNLIDKLNNFENIKDNLITYLKSLNNLINNNTYEQFIPQKLKKLVISVEDFEQIIDERYKHFNAYISEVVIEDFNYFKENYLKLKLKPIFESFRIKIKNNFYVDKCGLNLEDNIIKYNNINTINIKNKNCLLFDISESIYKSYIINNLVPNSNCLIYFNNIDPYLNIKDYFENKYLLEILATKYDYLDNYVKDNYNYLNKKLKYNIDFFYKNILAIGSFKPKDITNIIYSKIDVIKNFENNLLKENGLFNLLFNESANQIDNIIFKLNDVVKNILNIVEIKILKNTNNIPIFIINQIKIIIDFLNSNDLRNNIYNKYISNKIVAISESIFYHYSEYFTKNIFHILYQNQVYLETVVPNKLHILINSYYNNFKAIMSKINEDIKDICNVVIELFTKKINLLIENKLSDALNKNIIILNNIVETLNNNIKVEDNEEIPIAVYYSLTDIINLSNYNNNNNKSNIANLDNQLSSFNSLIKTSYRRFISKEINNLYNYIDKYKKTIDYNYSYYTNTLLDYIKSKGEIYYNDVIKQLILNNNFLNSIIEKAIMRYTDKFNLILSNLLNDFDNEFWSIYKNYSNLINGFASNKNLYIDDNVIDSFIYYENRISSEFSLFIETKRKEIFVIIKNNYKSISQELSISINNKLNLLPNISEDILNSFSKVSMNSKLTNILNDIDSKIQLTINNKIEFITDNLYIKIEDKTNILLNKSFELINKNLLYNSKNILYKNKERFIFEKLSNSYKKELLKNTLLEIESLFKSINIIEDSNNCFKKNILDNINSIKNISNDNSLTELLNNDILMFNFKVSVEFIDNIKNIPNIILENKLSLEEDKIEYDKGSNINNIIMLNSIYSVCKSYADIYKKASNRRYVSIISVLNQQYSVNSKLFYNKLIKNVSNIIEYLGSKNNNSVIYIKSLIKFYGKSAIKSIIDIINKEFLINQDNLTNYLFKDDLTKEFFDIAILSIENVTILNTDYIKIKDIVLSKLNTRTIYSNLDKITLNNKANINNFSDEFKKSVYDVNLNEFMIDANNIVDIAIKKLDNINIQENKNLNNIYEILEGFNDNLTNIKENFVDIKSFQNIENKSNTIQKEFSKVVLTIFIDKGIRELYKSVDNLIKEKLRRSIEYSEANIQPYIENYITSNIMKGRNYIFTKYSSLIEKIKSLILTEMNKLIDSIGKKSRVLNVHSEIDKFEYNLELILEEYNILLNNKKLFIDKNKRFLENKNFYSIKDMYMLIENVNASINNFVSSLNSLPQIKNISIYIEDIIRIFKNSKEILINNAPSIIKKCLINLGKEKVKEYWIYSVDYIKRKESPIIIEFNKIKLAIFEIPEKLKLITKENFYLLLKELFEKTKSKWAVTLFNSIILENDNNTSLVNKEFNYSKNFNLRTSFRGGYALIILELDLDIKAIFSLKIFVEAYDISNNISTEVDVNIIGSGSLADPTEFLKLKAGVKSDLIKSKVKAESKLSLFDASLDNTFCADLEIGKVNTFLTFIIGEEFLKSVETYVKKAEQVCKNILSFLGFIKYICNTFTRIIKIVRKVISIRWTPKTSEIELYSGKKLEKCYNFEISKKIK